MSEIALDREAGSLVLRQLPISSSRSELSRAARTTRFFYWGALPRFRGQERVARVSLRYREEYLATGDLTGSQLA